MLATNTDNFYLLFGGLVCYNEGEETNRFNFYP